MECQHGTLRAAQEGCDRCDEEQRYLRYPECTDGIDDMEEHAALIDQLGTCPCCGQGKEPTMEEMQDAEAWANGPRDNP